MSTKYILVRHFEAKSGGSALYSKIILPIVTQDRACTGAHASADPTYRPHKFKGGKRTNVPCPIVDTHTAVQSNILVDHNGDVFLCNIGVHDAIWSPGQFDPNAVRWQAPEKIRGGGHTTACDVYSFAMTILEVRSRGSGAFNACQTHYAPRR
jgi:hypothetical protein